MTELILTTFDWVPSPPRGFVRDIRVRWALEEAGLTYRVETTPFGPHKAEHVLDRPFGQAPWLTDAGETIFETGAILLHLGHKSEKLMPADARGRTEVMQWVFAALNSVEMASLPWSLFQFSGDTKSDGFKMFEDFLNTHRLARIEPVVVERDWLAGQFSVADILMADVLRLVDRFDGLANYPACRAYLQRATMRPSFKTAYADQMAHFEAADKARGG